MFTEIAFNEVFYDNMINWIDGWIIVQISINSFFALTLIIDWVFLGFKASFTKHPRVPAETLA